MLKLYEEFITYDKLHEIIKQLENRIKYWFNEGTLGKDTSLIELKSSLTDKYKSRTIILNFNNENYMYQCLFTISTDNADMCHIKLKRYDLNDQNLIDKLEDDTDINNIKEDIVIKMISEMEGKDENPDKNKIDVKEEEEEEKEPEEKEEDLNFNEDDFDLGGAKDEEFDEDEDEDFEF